MPTGSADTWAVPTPGASLPAPCLTAEGAVPGGSGQSRDGHCDGFLCDRRLLGAGLCPAPLFSEQSLPEVWVASGSVQTDVWAYAGREGGAPPTTQTGGHPHQGGCPAIPSEAHCGWSLSRPQAGPLPVTPLRRDLSFTSAPACHPDSSKLCAQLSAPPPEPLHRASP